MVEISTSILNMKDGQEAQTILELEKAKSDYYHIDVMDGKFVEKNTYKKMQNNCMAIKRLSNLPLDVHLMVENVKESIEDFLVYDPKIITFHYEACKNEDEVLEYINFIKENNCKVGISVKPDTDVKKVYKFLPYIHQVLVMTVEPGKGGQVLLVEMIDKVKKLCNYIKQNNIEIDIEVDGGINLRNVEKLKKAGANIIVAGVAILTAVNYKDIIDEMKK